MAKKQQNDVRKKQQDAVMYRALLDMVCSIFLLIALYVIDRNYRTAGGFDSWQEALRWISIGGAALALAGLVLSFLKKNRALSAWLLCGGAVIGVFALLLCRYWVEPLPYLYFLTIASGVLYMVWLLYPHDFFCITLLATLCGAAFYLHGKTGLGALVIALYAVSAVLLIAADLLTRKAAANGGVIRVGKARLRLLAPKGSPLSMYLCCAVLLACIAASLLLGSVFAYYCFYAAAGGLFIAACYYTIRLD